jgi:hypothetical protein
MGLETVVRPVVFPNIRPAPAQPQPPASDPTQGIAEINGSSGKFLDLQYSYSISSSQSNPNETRRRVDVARIYQKDDADNVNQDNFIDVEVPNRIWMDDGHQESRYNYASIEEADNIEIRERNKMKRRD